MNNFAKEFGAALREGRQPNCPLCHLPLEVYQRRDTTIVYEWSVENKRYEENVCDEECGLPMCGNCGRRCSDFLVGQAEDNPVCEQLGLVY